MAKPNPKAPEKTVSISCARCGALLYKYKKSGKGALVKCFKERIVKNNTTTPCQCPECQQIFAREMSGNLRTSRVAALASVMVHNQGRALQ